VVLELAAANIDSQANPALFTLGQGDRLTLKLGTSATLTEGTHSVRVVIYDATHPNGIVWTQIQISKLA
jgi:hypothetical protein